MASRMTVGKKFALSAGSLIVLTGVLGVISLTGLSSITKVVHSITDDSLAGVSACSKVEIEVEEIRVAFYKHLGFSDPKEKAALDTEIDSLKQRVARDLGEVEKAIATDEE